MTDRELMQQALEALEEYTNVVTSVNDPNSWVTVADGGRPAREAITALRERLAQLEQPAPQPEGSVAGYCKKIEELIAERDSLRAALAQPGQEPDYWLGYGLQAHTERPFEGATPLYTAPPQRKPLTDEEKAVLRECREQAMKWTVQGRIPECGAFGEIAQDLDWLCDQLAAHGIKEQA